jgi:hypothetical protein
MNGCSHLSEQPFFIVTLTSILSLTRERKLSVLYFYGSWKGEGFFPSCGEALEKVRVGS